MEAGTVDSKTQRAAAMIDAGPYGTVGRAEWMDFNWDDFSHQAMIGGKSVNYVKFGKPDGPPIVLIHGLAGSWMNWLENIPALGRDFRVIALDLPGFGASEMPGARISIPGYAQTVLELMDHLEIEKASIVGNSMGGQTALAAALLAPERIEKLVLVSPAGYSTSDMPAALVHASPALSPIIAASARFNRFAASRPRARMLFLTGVVAHPDKLTADLALKLFDAPRPGFGDALQALLAHDFRPELANIVAPTMLVWGRKDGLITSRDINRIAERIEGTRKYLLRDTAHVAMLERPAWFNETTRDFLLEQS